MMLPTYQRYVNGVPVSTKGKGMRLREKYVIGVVFLTFATVCFGAIFFLPEFRVGVDVRKGIDGVGRDLFFPGRIESANRVKDRQNKLPESDEKLRAEIEKDKQKLIAEAKLKEELAKNATALKNLEHRQVHEKEQVLDDGADALEKRTKIREVITKHFCYICS
jgi:hypothetical protein